MIDLLLSLFQLECVLLFCLTTFFLFHLDCGHIQAISADSYTAEERDKQDQLTPTFSSGGQNAV